MKLFKSHVLVAACLALAFAACSKSNDNSSGNPGNANQAGQPAPTPTPDPAHAQQIASLQGTWTTACQHGNGTSGNSALGISNQTYRQTNSTFIGNACTTSPDAVLIDDGTFAVGKEVTAGSGEFELDLTSNKVTIIPETAAGAAALNALSLCGKTDWAAGTSVDVTAQVTAGTCSGAHLKSYLAYQLRDSNHTLRVAQPTASNDGSAPDKRPLDMTTSIDYTK